MKRHLVCGVLLAVLVCATGIMVLSEAAEISYIEGRVDVQQTVDKVWKKAQVGDQVNIGDSIRTARRSKADVVLDKAKIQTLRIDEKTLVILNSTTASQINKLDLSKGKIYANVEELAGATFEVTTPSAVAGVRGTGWSVESDRKGDEVAAFKDNVAVKTYDANNNVVSDLLVNEGFKTIVERFAAASALAQLTPSEISQWNDVLRDLTSRLESQASQPASITAVGQAQEAIDITQENEADTKTQTEEKRTETVIKDDRLSDSYSH